MEYLEADCKSWGETLGPEGLRLALSQGTPAPATSPAKNATPKAA